MTTRLYKKSIPYIDKEGESRTAVAFYVDCGGILVPVKVIYNSDKESGKDPNYRIYKSVLTDYAQELSETITPR